MSERKLSVDTLRGLACFLLVAYHVIGHGPGSGLLLPETHPMARVNEMLSYLRMPLFSFLSGFVYAWRPFDGNSGRFVTGKLRRLIVPMLVVGTFFAILQAYTPGTNAGDYNWALLHIVPVSHFWFLESLFFVFLLVMLLERLQLLATPLRFVGVWLAAAALFLANPLPIYFSLEGAGYLLPFFLLGVGFNRFAVRLPQGLLPGATAALCVVAVLGAALANGMLPAPTSAAALLVGACSCIALLRAGAQVRWLAWIGAASFPIYLFHTMFTAASRIALTRAGVDEVAVLFACGLAAGILGPIVAAWVLRRHWLGYWVLGEKPKKPREAGGKILDAGSSPA